MTAAYQPERSGSLEATEIDYAKLLAENQRLERERGITTQQRELVLQCQSTQIRRGPDSNRNRRNGPRDLTPGQVRLTWSPLLWETGRPHPRCGVSSALRPIAILTSEVRQGRSVVVICR